MPRTVLVLGAALALAFTHLSHAAEAPPAVPPKHDPLQGMEPSGRIPSVERPEDLENPGRWRYIPEGRIKPGNVFERFLVTSFIAPQFFYEQDIGAGGGIALTDIDFRGQRRQEFLGAFFSYTTEGQQRYRLVWRRWLHHRDLPDGGVILEERSRLHASGGYEKSLTRRFFGLGPNTREDDETSYVDEVSDLGGRLELALPKPGGDWVATVGARGQHHNLAPGHISDRPTTDQIFPDLFDVGDGHSSLTLNTGLRYDTRDSQHQPHAGWVAGLFVEAPLYQSTGDVGAVTTAFGSIAFRLPPLFHRGGDAREEHPPTDTLALGLTVQSAVGNLPFYELPSLGGTDTLRGFIANRFTDNASWHAVVEYRFWLIPRGVAFTDTLRVERIGLALFYEAGTVADSLDKLPRALIHMSYGIGARFSLERTALFRTDVGFSREDVNISISFGLSF